MNFVCKLTRAVQFHSCGIRCPLHCFSSLSVIRRLIYNFVSVSGIMDISSSRSPSLLSRHVLRCVNSHFPFQPHQPLLKAVCSFNIFLARVLSEHKLQREQKAASSVTRSRPTRGNIGNMCLLILLISFAQADPDGDQTGRDCLYSAPPPTVKKETKEEHRHSRHDNNGWGIYKWGERDLPGHLARRFTKHVYDVLWQR